VQGNLQKPLKSVTDHFEQNIHKVAKHVLIMWESIAPNYSNIQCKKIS